MVPEVRLEIFATHSEMASAYSSSYTHLFLTNRGLLITPFHNMMLIPPVATEADIDLLIKGWDDCLAEITQLGRENWHKADIDADAEHVRT